MRIETWNAARILLRHKCMLMILTLTGEVAIRLVTDRIILTILQSVTAKLYGLSLLQL